MVPALTAFAYAGGILLVLLFFLLLHLRPPRGIQRFVSAMRFALAVLKEAFMERGLAKAKVSAACHALCSIMGWL